MKIDLSLYSLLNHILATGLGFFLALFISKKRKKIKSYDGLTPENNNVKRDSESFLSYCRNRIIRLILLFLYLILFVLTLRYNKLSLNVLITFISSFIIFFAFFKLKRTIGTLFVVLILSFIVMFVMLNRSLYILFHEEIVGKIKIVNIINGNITVNIDELNQGSITKKHTNVKLQGSQFGVFCFQLHYKKWLSFIGLEDKFFWAGVMGVNFSEIRNGRTSAQMDISLLDPKNFIKNERLWTNLEKKTLILPGIRAVQRVMVIKTPIIGATYKLIKHRTGKISLE